jgi:hypothetical protein
MGALGSVISLLGAVIVVVAVVSALRKNSDIVCVLRSWGATTAPTDAEGTYVRIVGRRAGIVAWALALIGIDPTVTFTVTGRNVIHEAGSWSGNVRNLLPIRHVHCLASGVARPWQSALAVMLIASPLLGAVCSFAAASFMGSVAGPSSGVKAFGALAGALEAAVLAFPLGIVLGVAIAIIYYLINKTIRIQVSAGSHSASIVFKRSLIESQEIDEATAARVVAIVQTLVDQQRAR